jgi:hypothetical protein
MNVLRVSAVCAEVALLGSAATIAWALVGGSSASLIVMPMIAALLAVETLRLPLVMNVPRLGLGGKAAALTLAAALACLTGETTALGVENLLNERAIGVTTAETKLAEAQTALDAAKAEAGRRAEEIAQAQAAVAATQRHAEEIGRESVTLQNNPAVSAYRTRKGWTTPGGSAANAAASANARVQADHAKRLAAAEADLAAARSALAAIKPVDVQGGRDRSRLSEARGRARPRRGPHAPLGGVGLSRWDRRPERRRLRVGAPGRDPEHCVDRIGWDACRRPDFVAARSRLETQRQVGASDPRLPRAAPQTDRGAARRSGPD